MLRLRSTAILLLAIAAVTVIATQDEPVPTTTAYTPTGKLSQFRGFVTPRPTGQLPSNANFMYASVWAAWSAWSFCVNGNRIRVRACNTVRGFSCMGTNREMQPCEANAPNMNTHNRRRFHSDYDVVDPYEQDRREAMNQLYPDDDAELAAQQQKPSGNKANFAKIGDDFKSRAAGVQTARLRPPSYGNPQVHGVVTHELTDFRRPPNRDSGMPASTPERLFGAKQFEIKKKRPVKPLEGLESIDEHTDSAESAPLAPIPPPARSFKPDSSIDSPRPLPVASAEDRNFKPFLPVDAETIQLRNEGKSFLNSHGMQPVQRTTRKPLPPAPTTTLATTTRATTTSATTTSTEPSTTMESTTVTIPIPEEEEISTALPMFSKTPKSEEKMMVDVEDKPLDEQSEIVREFFEGSQERTPPPPRQLSTGPRKLTKEELLEEPVTVVEPTPTTELTTQRSRATRPPSTPRPISPRVSTISHNSGEEIADITKMKATRLPFHTPTSAVLPESFPIAEAAPSTLPDTDKFDFDSIDLMRNLEGGVKKKGTRKHRKLKNVPLPANARVINPEVQRVFTNKESSEEIDLEKNQHVRSLDPEPSFVNSKVHGESHSVEVKDEKPKSRSFGITGFSFKRKTKKIHSGEMERTQPSLPFLFPEKKEVVASRKQPYENPTLPSLYPTKQGSSINKNAYGDEPTLEQPQTRTSGPRKIKKGKRKRVKQPVQTNSLTNVFPEKSPRPSAASRSDYDSAPALANVFPTGHKGEATPNGGEISEDTVKALDWMLNNITKMAEQGDENFLKALSLEQPKPTLVSAEETKSAQGVFPQPANNAYPMDSAEQIQHRGEGRTMGRSRGTLHDGHLKTEVRPAQIGAPGISLLKPSSEHEYNAKQSGRTSGKAHSGEFNPHSGEMITEKGISRRKFKKGTGVLKPKKKTPKTNGFYGFDGFVGFDRLKKKSRIHAAATLTEDKDDVAREVSSTEEKRPQNPDAEVPADQKKLLEEINRLQDVMKEMEKNIDAVSVTSDNKSPESSFPIGNELRDSAHHSNTELHQKAAELSGSYVRKSSEHSDEKPLELMETSEEKKPIRSFVSLVEVSSPSSPTIHHSAMDLELAPKNGFKATKGDVAVVEKDQNEPVFFTGHEDIGNEEAFWKEWSEWGPCFCNKQVRTRMCNYVEGSSGHGCSGASYESRECSGGSCPAKDNMRHNSFKLMKVEKTPEEQQLFTLAPNTRKDRALFKMHAVARAQPVSS